MLLTVSRLPVSNCETPWPRISPTASPIEPPVQPTSVSRFGRGEEEGGAAIAAAAPHAAGDVALAVLVIVEADRDAMIAKERPQTRPVAKKIAPVPKVGRNGRRAWGGRRCVARVGRCGLDRLYCDGGLGLGVRGPCKQAGGCQRDEQCDRETVQAAAGFPALEFAVRLIIAGCR